MSRTTAPSAVFFGPPASAPLATVPIIVIKSTAHGRTPPKKPQKENLSSERINQKERKHSRFNNLYRDGSKGKKLMMHAHRSSPLQTTKKEGKKREKKTAGKQASEISPPVCLWRNNVWEKKARIGKHGAETNKQTEKKNTSVSSVVASCQKQRQR
jgi:hypothetical protein